MKFSARLLFPFFFFFLFHTFASCRRTPLEFAVAANYQINSLSVFLIPLILQPQTHDPDFSDSRLNAIGVSESPWRWRMLSGSSLIFWRYHVAFTFPDDVKNLTGYKPSNGSKLSVRNEFFFFPLNLGVGPILEIFILNY